MKSPIRIERREKQPKPDPKYPWLVPLFFWVAIAILVGAGIAIAVLGIPLF